MFFQTTLSDVKCVLGTSHEMGNDCDVKSERKVSEEVTVLCSQFREFLLETGHDSPKILVQSTFKVFLRVDVFTEVIYQLCYLPVNGSFCAFSIFG